jgi:acetyltransferase-like isoleucine patch superfamily enzyme
VAPGAVLAGSIDVGNSSVIGMGATVYLGLTIGRDAMIFNGVNVLKNIPEGKIVDGN